MPGLIQVYPRQLEVSTVFSIIISVHVSVLLFFLHQHNKHGNQRKCCKNQHQPGDSMNRKIK